MSEWGCCIWKLPNKDKSKLVFHGDVNRINIIFLLWEWLTKLLSTSDAMALQNSCKVAGEHQQFCEK